MARRRRGAIVVERTAVERKKKLRRVLDAAPRFVKAADVPSFWYQLMELSPSSADSASMELSPSMSMAKVDEAPFAESSMML